jgi:uncharacterized membrane protein YeaQ/YmgE (transglycosylase-associated protein family)
VEEKDMWWNLLLLALIGFIAGALARWLIPGRYPRGVLATAALGMAGSLLGGLLSWAFWPAAEGQLHLAGVLMSILGALAALWAYSADARRGRA